VTQYLDREIPAASLEVVDRSTISGLVMPWNTDAEVVDLLPDGTVDRYVEAFAPGAFAGQDRSDNVGTLRKISLHDEHDGGLGKIGYVLELEDRDDGEHGLFRVLPAQRDSVLEMIADGIDGLSVRFLPKRGGTRLASMVGSLERRVRTAAHMVHVALVAEPAYATARAREQHAALEQLRAADRDREAAEILDRLEASATRWRARDTVTP
jgi:phage head maturation protease